MRRLACLLVLLAALPASTAFAQGPTGPSGPTGSTGPTGPPPEDRIALGVKAGHVDVGGLLISEAAAKLQQELTARLNKNIGIDVAGKRFSLKMKTVGLKLDAFLTARRAFRAGQDAQPPSGAAGGAAFNVDVPLAVTFKKAATRAFASSVARSVYLAPRNAELKITLRKMIKRRARAGRYAHAGDLTKAIDAVIADPAAKRLLKPGRKKLSAKINANHLVAMYPTVVTIDRANFKLRLFKGLKFKKMYGIAVGAPGYPTPTGRFRITNKAVNPVWNAPNKPWAGEFAGQRISGGSAANPLKARWLGIVNGVGIHGTGAEYSIGTRASHGCIRMRVADVIDLYPRVPVGTPVLIK